ncbi:MAG TPA: peroxiredoxin [Candidatus Acidoferrum sp.]|jgi:peroxiredoxin|nr:peroxiredoxin [Candidatus Acidoferrum sp.]
MIDPTRLPADLPRPVDDGAADHLTGTAIPSVALDATDGSTVDLSAVPGYAVVFVYPRTGRPGEPSLVEDWDQIPGARGCTPHTCGFRDLSAEFAALGARVYGLSTQESAYQREMVERLEVPFPVLSDAKLELADALRLPTFTVAGQRLEKRLAWIQRDGVIRRVFYPVFPPDRNASEVLDALRSFF